MSMEYYDTDRPLNAEEAFAITLLVTCEITKNVLIERSPGHKKRLYWLERLDKAIEGVNSTYDGFVPPDFKERAVAYHNAVEKAVNELLTGYKEMEA